MQWFNKQAEGGVTLTGTMFSTTVSGVDLLNLTAKGNKPFLDITLRTVFDLTDTYDQADDGVTHAIALNGEAIGTMKDAFCPVRGGLKRTFSLTTPLSFYFHNLTDNGMIHVTPNQFYQQDGSIMFMQTAGSPRYLLFVAKNSILHTEGKQLMVTAQAGDGEWRFIAGDSLEEIFKGCPHNPCK